MKKLLAILLPCLVICTVAPAALAQALADRIPGDAEIYIGWRGSDDLGPGYDSSHLKAVIDASKFSQL